MEKSIKNLQIAKQILEKRIIINKSLLEDIIVIKQDEKNIKEENSACQLALNIINRELRNKYRKKGKK